MSAQSIGHSHRLIADNHNLLANQRRSNHLMATVLHNSSKTDEQQIKCKNNIINQLNNNVVNDSNNNNMNSSSSKNGNHCGLNINNMFAMPLNNVSSLYLFNAEQHPIRTSFGQSPGPPPVQMSGQNSSAHPTHKSHPNSLNSIREGSTPSPLSLSSISNNVNESTGNTFSISKPSRTSDGLISGLNFNHSDVLREGGFMSYGSSPAENATSTPNSFTTSSLDGYLNGGQGGPSSNHSFDLLDSDSFSEMPNTLSPSCQTTYEDNSGHSYVDKQKQSVIDRNSGQPTRKKRKNGPPVRPACPDCGKEFSNQSALSKHKLTHSDERKFVCNQCSKAFKRQDHLNGHLLTHRSKKPYECDVEGCEKTYCDARSLRRHKENHHPAGSTNGQTSQSLQALAFIPLNFSTANIGLPQNQNQSMNRIQYAPPPPPQPPPSVTTPLVPPVAVSAEQSAATQLQRLALHKQDDNIHNNSDKWVPPSREAPSPQKWNQNQNSVINKPFISSEIEKQTIKSELYNKLQAINNSNSNLISDSSQENALLHQLLTQEQFKEKQLYQQFPQQLSQQHNHQNEGRIHHQQQQQQQQQNPGSHQQSHHRNHSPQHTLQPRLQPIQSMSSLESTQQSTSGDNVWPFTMFAQNSRSEPQLVECSLCQRKFKNIPALNGHMRLHGGYLKNQNNISNSSVNSKKDSINKADNSQVNASVKAILDVLKEKLSRKNQTNNLDNNLVPVLPPPLPPQQQTLQQTPSQVSHVSNTQPHTQQVINSPMAPILSPVTPVTPKTTDNTSTFSYDFHQTSANNQMHFSREDHELYYENEILLLKEQLQQSQQFRMPSQPSNMSNRFQAQEQRQQQVRRHSDSSDLGANCVDSNPSKQTINNSFQSNDCYSSQQFNDLLRRRTQRTCSDPGDQPLMTINTNYQSSHHQMFGNQYYHQSHSVPTTPTLCHNSSTLQPHSLPSTPTAAAAPVTFIHSPHQQQQQPQQQQQQQQQRGSLPNTPTDANQQFNFMAVPSPINQGSVHSQHSQYSASPASVAQYSPNTPYSPSHASVPQFTYSVPQQTQQTLQPQPQQNTQNVYSESQMYDAIHNYTNTGSDGHNITENFNFDNNLAENNSYYESQNDMMTDTAGTGIQIDSQQMGQISSLQSLPQTSKEQFFGNYSQHSTPITSHEYNSIATTSNYVQSTNYWTQSSLTNSVQTNHLKGQSLSAQVVPNLTPKSTIVENPTHVMYSVPTSTPMPAHLSANQMSNPSNIVCMSSSDHQMSGQSQTSQSRSIPLTRRSTSSPPLVVNLERIDESNEETDDVFLSPVGVAPSPKRTSPALPVGVTKRAKHRPEPLYIPPHVNTCGYQSRLRSPRLWDPSAVVDTKNLSPPPYTPPPMLSPVRSGPGLFWHIISGSMTPKSGTMTPKFVYSRKSSVEVKEEPITAVAQTPTTAYEPFDCEIPETDIQPHVNIGPNFQARIPAFNKNKDEAKYRAEKADLVWDPTSTDSLTEDDIESYLELSCCACIPGSGRNKEYAMHLLHIANGDIHNAIVKLLEPHPTIKEGHPLSNYHYPENDIWVPQEIEAYQSALNKCDKDFFSIAKEVGTKSVKQCIQFYYMWKKVCPDEYRRLRVIRRKREHETIFYNLRSKEGEENNNNIKMDLEIDNNTANSGQSSDIDDNVSSLMDSTNPSPATSVGSQQASAPTPVPEFSYPCKLCGKVFQKVKSRSAHMKIHGSGSAKY